MASPDSDALLEVRDLRVEFHMPAGIASAVNGVDLSLQRGQALGLVGESGSGKSVTALSILRLLPTRSARIPSGSVLWRGESLLDASLSRMRSIRGAEIAMIFQDPMTSLNPVMTIGAQVAEAVRLHRKMSRKEAWNEAVRALSDVGIPDAGQRARDYPHQFSGGMRQRAMIAMAVSCEPELLIADEPTTALDVTVQAEILALLRRLREERGLAILLISHDLGVIAEFCDEAAIMYAGRIVERSSAAQLFESPRHPYAQGLLQSTPDPDAPAGAPFQPIPGSPPRPGEIPAGCPFHPRCGRSMPVCESRNPPLIHWNRIEVACHLYQDDENS
jgi:oligopeptide/dipeptide ABC transporter ATP-binding protein